jgi:NitT/TauT family transport system substrate-binding protein
MFKSVVGAAVACALAFISSAASSTETVRIGALKFGTVNWELAAMKANGLDTANGIAVEVVHFAGEDASNVAFQAGEVDVIVSDWLWVSRLRSEGEDVTFAPYSSSVGALMVRPESGIGTLADLKGKRIGVAGGPLDKNWLLIQGLARRDLGRDLAADNEIVYGAPPLLSEKAEQGELDAVLSFWHFCARLEAKGFVRLVSGEDAAAALGSVGPVAALGYVFREGWASEHPKAAAGLIRASQATKSLLKSSDAEWERLAREGVIKDEGAAFAALRDRYREGIPARPVEEEEVDAAALYAILADLGGEKLVGPSPVMAPGTYWPSLKNGF